jgi:nicotinamidase-related amidase
MPLTQLDPMAALVVIDLQKFILTLPDVADLIDRSAGLAHAFRERKLPVVLVNVTGMPPGRTEAQRPSLSSLPPDWSDLIPALSPSPSDILITKRCWGAYIGTTLHDQLRARGVTQIVLTGVSTSIGVESTARSAYEYGYHVVLVTDAMTDRDPVSHQHSIEKIFPRLGETATAAEVMARLQQPS